MRYIDPDALQVSDDWMATAESRAEEIAAAHAAGDSALASELLKTSRPIWAEVKAALELLSAKKCWYCEMRQERSDLNVDHFRPKSRVSEAPDHPGYWWLALDPTNFRLSCQFCNQRRRGVDGAPGGGKSDHFPLRDESYRAFTPQDDLISEGAVLVDPTQAVDVALLSVDYLGRVFPNPQKCREGGFELDRVMASIELYHLNHRGIVDARKALNRTLKRDFDLAIDYLQFENRSRIDDQKLAETIRALRSAIGERSTLSAAARAYVRSRRADGPTAAALIEELLEY